MVINLKSELYKNLQNPTEQIGIFTCNHEGECGDSCPCRINKTTCREACKCPPDCPHRFPYCDCEKACETGCVCIDHGRECVPGKCRNGRCIDGRSRVCYSFRRKKPWKSLRVSKSTIPGAGNGLFTCEAISAHQCIGRYRGDVMHDALRPSHGGTAMTSFAIAKDSSIQGLDPRNFLYFLNHPSGGKKANAEFRSIEGPSERFIVLMPLRNIRKNEEIFAEYSTDFHGFDKVSGAQNEKWWKQFPDVNDYSVGEYILIYGKLGKSDDAEVWVGKIAKKYEGDYYGIHWMYHPSHLPLVEGLKLRKCITEKTPNFEPWELIISEHAGIFHKSVIMSRVRMIERAKAGKEKMDGTWWWDWVIKYSWKQDPVTKATSYAPIIVPSKEYFKKRREIADWDVNDRAQEMGLKLIKSTKEEKIVKGDKSKESTIDEVKKQLGKEEKLKRRSETPLKKRKRMVGDAPNDDDQGTPKPKRQRTSRPICRDAESRSHLEAGGDEQTHEALSRIPIYYTRSKKPYISDDELSDDEEPQGLHPDNNAERRISTSPSNIPDRNEDTQPTEEACGAVKALPNLLRTKDGYSLRSKVQESDDELSDIGTPRMAYLSDPLPDPLRSQEEPIEELDLADG